MRSRSGAMLVFLACSSASLAAAEDFPFDGRWSVLLVCADTQDKRGVVKGYQYAFTVTIRDGALQGEYGAPGHPASVVYTGQVGTDGALQIQATGNTGRSDYSVGEVAQGTPYGYTMQGMLERSRGQATRKELRPCTATFSRR
ncbi:MAG: hypothetical protein M3O01_00985 [Pseudomonadota bacterium]|nr:hypothetical protein [Pseudomonadota bacterium]